MSLGHSGSFTADKSREFFCGTCGARCTRSINGDLHNTGKAWTEETKDDIAERLDRKRVS